MKKYMTLFSCFLLGLITSAGAQNGTDAGQIFEESVKNLSLKNVRGALDLQTTDEKGNKKNRELSVIFAEFGPQKKVMIEITAPENVKGTRILATDFPDKEGIIQVYMPASGKIQKYRATKSNLKRVGKNIPVNHFSNAKYSEYEAEMMGQEIYNDIECYKIHLQVPGETEHRIAFVSKEKEQLLRMEEYDEQNELIAFTELSEYFETDIPDHKYYPRKVHIKDIKSGKVSEMTMLRLEHLKLKADDLELKTTGS
ncbi:MAG: outer membrane lipoprotein-sorting protein [Marinilabilia sp.]